VFEDGNWGKGGGLYINGFTCTCLALDIKQV
jgi:hypothetical protein